MPEILIFKAANSLSTFLISKGSASSLNLKHTMCRILSFDEVSAFVLFFLSVGLADDSMYMNTHIHTQVEATSRISTVLKFM